MFKKIRIMSLIVVTVLVFSSMSVSSQGINYIDQRLINMGFPETLVNDMSEPQKEFMYECMYEDGFVFCDYTEKNYTITNDGEVVQSSQNGDVSLCGGTLSENEISVSVVGAKQQDSQGNVTYMVLPCFKWKTLVKVNNDSFAMAMYPGWEAVPGKRNLRLHLLNNNDVHTQYVDLSPTQATSSGYVYKIPSNIGAMQGKYEGYANYYVDRKSDTASPNISLYYAHDAQSFLTASYSLNIHGFTISLTGNTNHIYSIADNYYVKHLLGYEGN